MKSHCMAYDVCRHQYHDVFRRGVAPRTTSRRPCSIFGKTRFMRLRNHTSCNITLKMNFHNRIPFKRVVDQFSFEIYEDKQNRSRSRRMGSQYWKWNPRWIQRTLPMREELKKSTTARSKHFFSGISEQSVSKFWSIWCPSPVQWQLRQRLKSTDKKKAPRISDFHWRGLRLPPASINSTC